MRIFSASNTRRRVLCGAGRSGLTLALLVVFGLTVASSEYRGAAQQRRHDSLGCTRGHAGLRYPLSGHLYRRAAHWPDLQWLADL